jgi:alcohol dehydrogenase YqhD (iron-dependent ADH family)
METIGTVIDFLVKNSEAVYAVLGLLGLAKWFQSDWKQRAAKILSVADEVFDVVEAVSEQFGWKGAEKWSRFFDSVTAKLRLAGIELRESEIRKLERHIQERAKTVPHLNVTPVKGKR